VQPIDFESEEDRMERETKIRKDKIDALIEGVDFELKKEHEPILNSVTTGKLFHLDYKYGDDETEDDN